MKTARRKTARAKKRSVKRASKRTKRLSRGLRKSLFAFSPKSSRHHNDRWLRLAWIIPALFLTLGVIVLRGRQDHVALNVSSPKLVSLFAQAPNGSINDRVVYWSERLMRTPDLLATLSPGPKINDSAPLFPRHYDCTTFVETVGALATSATEKDLSDRIISIRYRGGKIGYRSRNHFPEADWIPNNEYAGNLRDITLRVARAAGFIASFAHKDIDKLAWFRSQRTPEANRVVASTDSKEEVVTVRLPYVPIAKFNSVLKHLESGTIVNVVRENRAASPVLVSHQGVLVKKGSQWLFRHASRNREITEVPLEQYLASERGLAWKVLGFNLNTFAR